MSQGSEIVYSMLEQAGRVIESDDTSALVETERKSACGQCGVGESCGTSSLAKVFKTRSNAIRLKHDLQLRPGDEVIIGIPESSLMRTALLAYMVPMLSMLGFAMMISLAGYGNVFVVLGSMTGLYCGIRLASVIRSRNPSDAIVLLRKVGSHTVVVDFKNTQR